MDNFGFNFAPTGDNAMNGERNGQLSGVPQAIQVLSLALPRVLGARSGAPSPLLNAPGAQGMDPAGSALMQTLMKALGLSTPAPGQPGSLPGGTAGPNPRPHVPGPGGPFTRPPDPAIPNSGTNDFTPHISFIPPDVSTPPMGGRARAGAGGLLGSPGKFQA